jgi:hypothetical protein
MLAVRRKSDNVVLYLFPDGQDLRINRFGMWSGMQRAVDIFPETHEIVENVHASCALGLRRCYGVGRWLDGHQSGGL